MAKIEKSYSSSSSSKDEDVIERKSVRKSRKKHKKRHRHYDDEDDGHSDEEERRKSKKSIKRKKHSKSRKCRGDYNSSDDSVNNEEDVHKKKKDKKHRRKARDAKVDIIKEDPSEANPFVLKYGAFLPKLHDLLSNHGDLGAELPYLLIKLCSGSSINLSQIPDFSVSIKLREIFIVLGCTAIGRDEFIFDDNGSWKKSSQIDDERALVLVKLVRFLLVQNDLTIETITDFEQNKPTEHKNSKALHDAKKIPIDQEEPHGEEMSSLILMLLDTFQSKQPKQTSSMAQELCSIMQMISDGEIICLNGLEDDFLREAIEKFFSLMGLVKEEMDDSDEEDDTDKTNKNGEKQVSYGYTLPNVEDGSIPVKQKLHAAIEASKNYHHKKAKQKIGPILPKDAASYQHENPPDSEDEGPAPFGSQKARARSTTRQIVPAQNPSNSATLESKREEWMMAPGEHNFLKGVMTGGAMKSRKFKNEKNSNPPPAPKPMNPEIKQQVDQIMDAHKAARGPSLIEQHRLQQAEEKAALPKGKNGESWNWSRTKDLDAGRRVDKKYLNMVMGGASTDLNSKFQGSYSAGFT